MELDFDHVGVVGHLIPFFYRLFLTTSNQAGKAIANIS